MKRFIALLYVLTPLLCWFLPLSIEGAPGVVFNRVPSPEGWRVEQEEIVRMLESHFQQVLQDPKKRIEIKDLRGVESISFPPGILSCEILVPEHALRGGTFTATLIFLVNGQEAKRIRITASVGFYVDVVSAKHHLRRHQELQEKDVKIVNRNVSLLSNDNDIVTELKDVLGHRTTLSINGQEILRKSMVEVPPMVRKGDRVIMAIENPQFKITAWGEVRDEGRKGDRIKLVNPSSKKEVFGRVLDANTVQIDY